MANVVLNDAVILWDQYDLSADHNQIGLALGADLLDDTVFGDDTRSRKPGLRTVSLNGSGFWEGGTGELDDVLNTVLTGTPVVVTVSPDGGEEGEPAYSFQPVVGSYQIGGELGQMFPFTVTAEGKSAVFRGTVMQNGAETATGSATPRQLGAVGATQKLYAALHVLAVAGTTPTLDVTVRSDNGVGMATPTTQITFAQATAVGAQWATPIAGAITDDWFDVRFVIGGTGSPSFTFVVVVGFW